MVKINKNILDWFLQRFSYKLTKRILTITSFVCLILTCAIPLLDKGIRYSWFVVGTFIASFYLGWLIENLRDHYGLANGDSDVIHEVENNLYKYFDDIKAGEKYIMIQRKEIYPPLKEFLEKEHYAVYYECDRYAVYEKKSEEVLSK